MTRRMLRICGVAFAVVFTLLVAGPSGQAPAPKSQSAAPPKHPTYATPRTAWGDPDLQGTWNNGTITPLERPRGAGEKELLSKDEEEEINQQSDARAAAENRPTDRAQDVELAYRPVLVGPRQVDRPNLAHHRSEGRPSAAAHSAGAEAAR